MFIAVVAIAAISGGIFLSQPQFDSPQEAEKTLAQKSVNSSYVQGEFENIPPVPVMTRSGGGMSAWFKFLFQKDPGAVPDGVLPSEKTDLKQLPKDENLVVWMGHSTVFVQMDGHAFLFDPVFSCNASPVPYTNLAFAGSNIYTAADMPHIDYLIISHDHWDHLDYPTVHALKAKVDNVITPLGVGSYFRQWGYADNRIHELDWKSSTQGNGLLTITAEPSIHFSGRMFTRNKTLWASYIVTTENHKIFVSGDTGYGEQFKEIGQQQGPFDLAILENGQYDKAWARIHMFPEQTAQAAVELKAEALMPEHNSKFKEAHHPWQEPMERLTKASKDKPYKLLTPMIGQPVYLDKPNPQLTRWWRLPLKAKP